MHLCKSYFPEDELIDIYRAATAFKKGAVLITNDRLFDKIDDEKIIEIWSIRKLLRNLELELLKFQYWFSAPLFDKSHRNKWR